MNRQTDEFVSLAIIVPAAQREAARDDVEEFYRLRDIAAGDPARKYKRERMFRLFASPDGAAPAVCYVSERRFSRQDAAAFQALAQQLNNGAGTICEIIESDLATVLAKRGLRCLIHEQRVDIAKQQLARLAAEEAAAHVHNTALATAAQASESNHA